MSDMPLTRALTDLEHPQIKREIVTYETTYLQLLAQHMYALMLRNVSSNGFGFADSTHTLYSSPGCVMAAPSYPAEAPGTSQDYVFNWTRDAAITALEIAAATWPGGPGPVQTLADYVSFAQTCQQNATPTMGHACFTIEGQPRPWSEQNDGPAIQTIALLAAFAELDATSQQTATALIGRNIDYLLTCYKDATTNLWEEHSGFSFFARAVQLRCLQELTGNKYGIVVPPATAGAIEWLQNALTAHWNGAHYVTMIGGASPGQADVSAAPLGYDPNIDIVQACIYGAVSCTDTRLLATAALLRRQWADKDSATVYPINLFDQSELGIGPMLGRYPGDLYDGDDGGIGNHPWALCTANFAQLYYQLANEITATGSLPFDELSSDFFGQVGISDATPADVAASTLQAAGDQMLRAVAHHSDHLELSEQFDGVSGYEKSVRDLTWSYAAFLSAVRERTGQAVHG